MRDFRGVEIKAGDRIAYTSRRGSTLQMREAIVYYAFSDPPCCCCHRTDNQRTVTLHQERYIAMLERGEPSCP